MMTPQLAQISRLVQTDREAAAEKLRQLALDSPAEFLELIGLLFAPAGEPPPPFQFVISKPPGSENRT